MKSKTARRRFMRELRPILSFYQRFESVLAVAPGLTAHANLG